MQINGGVNVWLWLGVFSSPILYNHGRIPGGGELQVGFNYEEKSKFEL